MGYNTASTEWPTIPIPSTTKALIDKFFNLLDNKDPDVGNILADQIFAKDAKAQFGPHTFEGQERMLGSWHSPPEFLTTFVGQIILNPLWTLDP